MQLGDSQVNKLCISLSDGLDDHRLMVEVACGATVSLVYEDLLEEAIPNLTEKSTVVLIICGGTDPLISCLTHRIERDNRIFNGVETRVLGDKTVE